MNRARVLPLLLGFAATSASAQTIYTYTQNQTGSDKLPYGLPVPLPVESLTPVDGFRSYASLEARLQGLALASDDLSAHDVGRTHAGRTIWAYVASDADAVDVEGRPEAAFFINAATHAREWAAPEVSTGTLERLVAGADDGGLVRYLLDNTRIVVIPVHNIDGFLQTQRYPTQVIIGGDPDVANWPRDGRMRRKNMPNVDEVLTTFGDRLGGIDLNRNHPPFWATSVGQGGSSSNPASLVFHGAGPHSEPENRAIEVAAELGPASRMRLGIDLHSFSRVFYSSNTARATLNTIQASLIQKLRLHHLALSGKNYNDVPDPPNRGIGAAAEYFAYEWLVPAWTLELEPQDSPVEYGGLNVNHGGFILPASQARRVRDAWAETHAIAFYIMSGPPYLARVRVYLDGATQPRFESKWQYDPASGNRIRVQGAAQGLQPGVRHRIELAFNKPMRLRGAAGEIVALPGTSQVPSTPSVALVRDGARIVLDTSQGEWLTDPARKLRYRDDTFAFEFDAPADAAEYRLEVAASDLAGAQLDSNPATPADWADGSWTRLEGANGAAGINGGPDSTLTLAVANGAAPTIEQVGGRVLVGEGDFPAVGLRRARPGPERIEVRMPPQVAGGPQPAVAWEPGESGDKLLRVGVDDDVLVQGDRDVTLVLALRVDGLDAGTLEVPLRVLDNDSADESVVRAMAPWRLTEAVTTSNASGAARRSLVLDGGQEYRGPDAPNGACTTLTIAGPALVHGNRARFVGGSASCGRALEYSGEQGEVDLRDLALHFAAPATASKARPDDTGLLLGRGKLALRRVQLGYGVPVVGQGTTHGWLLSHDGGDVEFDRVRIEGFDGATSGAAVRLAGTRLRMQASTVRSLDALDALRLEGAGLELRDATLLAADADSGLVSAVPSSRLGSHNSLLQSPTGSQRSLCNGIFVASSAGFNLAADASCRLGAANDRVVRALPTALSELDGNYLPPAAAIDQGAAECDPIDQRGAPRPQTLTPGATPRCDVGAIELGVNPYRGAWSGERNGHGVDIQTTGNQLFLIWYTYQDDGQPTAYSAIAPLTGPHWETDLRLTSRDPQNGAITTVSVGRVTLDFDSDVDARLGWRFDARGTTGSERIRPSQATLGEPRFEATGLWSAPGDGGYGVNIMRVGPVTGATTYFYDAQGIQRWALGVSNDADASDFEMTSFTGFCPDCDAAANPVVGHPAGRLRVHFLTPQRARMDWQLVYPGAAGGSWNRTGTLFVPLNDPVDNRAARAALPP